MWKVIKDIDVVSAVLGLGVFGLVALLVMI